MFLIMYPKSTRRNAVRNERLTAQLEEATIALNEQGVKPVFLKEQPALRQRQLRGAGRGLLPTLTSWSTRNRLKWLLPLWPA